MPRVSDTPTPGFYLVKLRRDGPWVGASISHTEDGWCCTINGHVSGPSQDPWSVDGMGKVHWGGRETTEAEVAYRLALKAHAEMHDPEHPAANPHKPISLDDFKPI